MNDPEKKELEQLISIIDKPHYNEIWPNLYLGSIDTIYDDPEFTASLGAVVSLVCPDHDGTDEESIKRRLPPGCEHMYIAISDSYSADIQAWFKPCYAFVAAHMLESRRILVHCIEGRSRSATMMCYILKRENPKLTLVEVVTMVKNKRMIVRPNTEFLRQLIKACADN